MQALGFWPLNVMQHRLAHKKIAGGMQRFRAGIEPDAANIAPEGPAPTPLVRTKRRGDRRALPVVE